MNIQFKLLTEKTTADQSAPVYLFFYYKDYQFRYFTKEKCEPKHWDADKQKFKRSLPGYQEANDYLAILKEKVSKAYREYLQKGIIPTPAMLKSELLPEQAQVAQKQKLSFIALFEEFIQVGKLKGKKPNTLRRYTITLNHFKHYAAAKGKLDIENYTLETHEKFLRYLYGLNDYHPNSLVTIVKNLKVFFKFCQEERNLQLHPDHAKLRTTYVDTDKIFLTWEDIERLRAVALKPHLEKIRDAFLFACFTSLRYSDLFKLSPNHILDKGEYKVISLMPDKTVSSQKKLVKRLEIALNPYALEIIERYQGKQVKSLPMLTNQKMNEALKEIGQLAGITQKVETVIYQRGEPKSVFVPKYELITMHTARHTFATQSLLKGMPIELLQKILGHSDLKTTMIYAKIVDEFKHKVMLDVWHR